MFVGCASLGLEAADILCGGVLCGGDERSAACRVWLLAGDAELGAPLTTIPELGKDKGRVEADRKWEQDYADVKMLSRGGQHPIWAFGCC